MSVLYLTSPKTFPLHPGERYDIHLGMRMYTEKFSVHIHSDINDLDVDMLDETNLTFTLSNQSGSPMSINKGQLLATIGLK